MTLPNCRIFLVAPGDGDADLFAQCLSAALAAGDVASLLVLQATDVKQTNIIASRLLPIAQSGDVALLIENDTRLAKQLNADGVEIPADLLAYKSARAFLGNEVAIGIDCAGDRHIAMELAEAGADYVRLDPFAPGPNDENMMSWWSQLFEIPCIAAGPLEAADITRAAQLGADFVQPSDQIWTSPQHATDVISQSMTAIEDSR